MAKECTLIFPHQLFRQHPALSKERRVLLIEEDLFFNQYQFHQKKLLLHRASMKYYAHHLWQMGYDVTYVEAQEQTSSITACIEQLGAQGCTLVHYADTTDNWLESQLHKAVLKAGIGKRQYHSPLFLNRMEEVEDFFNERKRYFQTDFYTWQRRQRNLLLQNNGQPLGGKWTFDTENRKKFPKDGKAPSFTLPPSSEYVREASAYVQKFFSQNPGDPSPPFGKREGFYPVTHEEAELWLEDFLQQRFAGFGDYEDAMVVGEGLLFHSGLTPMLNIGLLTPDLVIEKALDAAVQQEIPLNALEGFIRQVVGWREFIRIVYEREGSRQRTTNYWGFKRKIPPSFWNGTTGIGPVDTVIRKTLQSGYAHHIERLMVMGNFMLLCEFDPDEVYRWFMEMYVDAYDWVMVPNVYGMTQFADGGLMTTKPYISGSNYLMKMGNWEKGPWQETWDALFWRFMHVHRDFFLGNPRLGMLVRSFDKMEDTKKKALLTRAEDFLAQLDPVCV